MHWADVVADKLLESGKEHVISSGITPSGPIHLGSMREILTADAIVRAVNDKGGNAKLLYVADNADPLRKVYPFLDEKKFKEYVGRPLAEIPAPDGNGSYDPSTDIPGYPGADQTLWTIANDVPTIVSAAGDSIGYQSTAPNLYGADPIGIELQITMWGYAFGAGAPLGNMIFKKATLKYTGLPDSPTDSKMEDLYFTQWSDPDLGTYTDDYVGCDIDLSFGYVYNGNRLDGVFNGIHNLPCPVNFK